MAGERIRSVKPEWLEDEKLASTSDTARMVSIALIVLSDDHGRGRANRLYLAGRIWPYASRDPRETLASLAEALRELSDSGFLDLYTVNGQDYFAIRNWRKHQKVDHPSKPRVPEPTSSVSREPLETLAPDQGSGSGSGSGTRSEDRAGAREAPPPAPSQVTEQTPARPARDPLALAPFPESEIDRRAPPRYVLLGKVWNEVNGSDMGAPSGFIPDYERTYSILDDRARRRGVTDLEVFREAAERYVAARKAANKSIKLHFFCKDFTEWCDALPRGAADAPRSATHRPYVTLAERERLARGGT